jgi:hypothetical protein
VPGLKLSLLVQALETQLQPEPVIETNARPVGIVSVTATVPAVALPDAPFDTVRLYVADVWPG